MVSEDRSLIAIHDDVPPLADDHLVALAEAAERRVEAINRIKQAALKATNAHDWVDQQGRPYLQVSGAEKIARLFGISWRIDEPILEREEDGHFAFTYKGYFRMGVVEIEVIGSRSSRDPFFSKARGEDIPPSAIDRQNVKKAALTNCIGNGITRLLGSNVAVGSPLQFTPAAIGLGPCRERTEKHHRGYERFHRISCYPND